MKLLIIGGSGHVSGTLARTALAAGHQVWTLTRGQRPLPAGARALVADRHDLAATAAAVAGAGTTWDLVVDCICFQVADMQQDLALFGARAAQFVLISTDFVYDPAHRRFPQPENATHYATGESYGARKRQCELALAAGAPATLAWTFLRPNHIYGPSSELGCLPLHGRDRELIPRLRAGTPLQLVGGGHFLQQPIMADDLAACILSIAGNARAAGQTYNATGPEIIESWQYYQIIADVLGVGLQVAEVPVAAHRAAHPDQAPFLCHRIYDLSRLRAAGLAVPATPLAVGLRQHVQGLLARR